MSTVPGTQIGPYVVDREIGRGGMGVVFAATDSRLGRAVAIKALPEHLNQDPDRLARFEREARTLASLSHTNVAQIFGVEEHEGARYLVLEFVEGQTLAEKLDAGPLEIDEAMQLGAQIAAGLEAAHEAGVIHRDLKPANIKLTPSGTIKVLDFGLAKTEENTSSSGSAMTATPTLSTPPSAFENPTTPGAILGTAPYMSPEQARGRTVDRRTDIWSFGVVLYECLTGIGPFAAETMTDTLGAIVYKEASLENLPDATPLPVRRLLRRCLTKDPKRRLRDIGDARVELEDALAGPEVDALPIKQAGTRVSSAALIAAIVLVIAASALTAWLLAPGSDGSATPRGTRLSVELLPNSVLNDREGSAVAISPDGQTLVFIASDEGQDRLFARRLDQLEPVPLSGTEDARMPFFSPDGSWVGFFTNQALRKVAITGGAPLTLAPVQTGRGGSWSSDGYIYYVPDTTTGIHRIPDSGGSPEQLTEPSDNERSHRWPHILPDNNAVLFISQAPSSSYDEAVIEAFDLTSRERVVVHSGGSYPLYAASGHLLYVHAGTLFAVGFNPDTLETTSPPAPILEGISGDSSPGGNGGASVALSPTGTIVFKTGSTGSTNYPIVWFDAAGQTETIVSEASPYRNPRLSPDDSKIAVEIPTPNGRNIWIRDINRGALSRLTFGAEEMMPIWTPDGLHITYASEAGGSFNIFQKRADGVGAPRRLTDTDRSQHPHSWSPDGRVLAFQQDDPDTTWNIYTQAFGDDGMPTGEPELFVGTPFIEAWPEFSPDGRWIAYTTQESGRPELYVRPYPGPGGRWQVSVDGGRHPRWSDDGSKLFFTFEDTLYVSEIDIEAPSFVASNPEVVLKGGFAQPQPFARHDVASDGQRFIMMPTDPANEATDRSHVIIAFDWFDELERLTTRR